MASVTLGSTYAALAAELDELLPDRGAVVDVHTHLGVDEDGQSLDLPSLLGYLDQVDAAARACVFPLHDPDRHLNEAISSAIPALIDYRDQGIIGAVGAGMNAFQPNFAPVGTCERISGNDFRGYGGRRFGE